MADEETATVEAPTGPPFGGETATPPVETPRPDPGAEPTPEQPAPDPPAPEQPAPETEPSEPDLSEQEQALAAKIAASVAQEMRSSEEPASELSTDDAVARLLGQEPEPQPGEQQPYDQQQPYGDEGYVDPDQQALANSPLLNDPAFRMMAEELGALRQHLAASSLEQNDAAVRTLADENPDLRQPEMLGEVEALAEQLAERAGDPELATDIVFVETALKAVRSARAKSPEVPAEQARTQGATLETEAGAAVDSTPDPDDQWWGRVKGAGGEAFPV